MTRPVANMRGPARRVGSALVLALLAACAGTDVKDSKPADVRTGVPDWGGEQNTPPRATQKAAPGDYTTSEPDAAQLAADKHRESLLTLEDSTLPPDEVGYYMDIQEARLIQLLRDTDVSAERSGNTFQFVLDAAFATNSTTLLDPARLQLEPIARVLSEYDRTRIAVYGYTDDVGDADYNQKLSVRRASAVARFLEDKGVDPRRLFVVGFGEAHPIADNTSVAGRASNRRVELVVETLAQPPAAQEADTPTQSG